MSNKKLPDKIDLDSCGPGTCGQNAYVDETNYSECVPWEDPQKLLVLGGTITGAPYEWEDFLVENSVKYTKHSKLVIDLEVDEEIYQTFVKNFGTGSMLFSRAGGQGRITRAGWKEMYGGRDALKGMIMKTLNKELFNKGKGGIKYG
jgi:hypothetical protein